MFCLCRRQVDRVLDFGQQSGPRPTTRSSTSTTAHTTSNATSAGTDANPPAATESAQNSSTDSSGEPYKLFFVIAVLVFLLGLVVGFVPLVLITKHESSQSNHLADSSALSQALDKAYQVVFTGPVHVSNRTHGGMSMCSPTPSSSNKASAEQHNVAGLVLSAGQGVFLQWQDVGGSTLNRSSCLVWNSGPFGSGHLGLDTCGESNR